MTTSLHASRGHVIVAAAAAGVLLLGGSVIWRVSSAALRQLEFSRQFSADATQLRRQTPRSVLKTTLGDLSMYTTIEDSGQSPAAGPVRVLFFDQPGCAECSQAWQAWLPALDQHTTRPELWIVVPSRDATTSALASLRSAGRHAYRVLTPRTPATFPAATGIRGVPLALGIIGQDLMACAVGGVPTSITARHCLERLDGTPSDTLVAGHVLKLRNLPRPQPWNLPTPQPR